MTIRDYYWNEEDYEMVFNKAGFLITEKYYPKESILDGGMWKDELQFFPYTIYVLKKEL